MKSQPEGFIKFPISDRKTDLINLAKWTAEFKSSHPEMAKNSYPEELCRLIESYIVINLHGCCMDVKSERHRVAKQIYNLLLDLSK